MQTKFTYSKMRRTFYAWHSGQNSPLYAAASSGLVADIPALQREILHCAESLWNDSANRKHSAYVDGKPTQSHMKAAPYAEWQYLKALADALPRMLKTEVLVCGKAYAVLPWVSRSYFPKESTK